MTHRSRTLPLAALTLGLALTLEVLAPASASARGRPWPGHPDRRIVTHVVQPGDTATGLATRYHAWTRELIALNHLGPRATVHVGERLRIPVVLSAVRRHRRTAAPSQAPAPRAASATTARTAKTARMRAAGWRHWRMSRAQISAAIAREAHRRGVPVRLAQAVAWQESGWHQPVRSSAGAIGVMQVLPATGLWMSIYASRPLNLRDTHDNITAGVTLLAVLLEETGRTRHAVAAYYQGLGAVRRHGLYPGTKKYVASVLAIRGNLADGR